MTQAQDPTIAHLLLAMAATALYFAVAFAFELRLPIYG